MPDFSINLGESFDNFFNLTEIFYDEDNDVLMAADECWDSAAQQALPEWFHWDSDETKFYGTAEANEDFYYCLSVYDSYGEGITEYFKFFVNEMPTANQDTFTYTFKARNDFSCYEDPFEDPDEEMLNLTAELCDGVWPVWLFFELVEGSNAWMLVGISD